MPDAQQEGETGGESIAASVAAIGSQQQQPRYRFELITAAHDVSGFACENQVLNVFLTRGEALRETVEDLSRTYLLLDAEKQGPETLAGYFTVCANSIYTQPAGRSEIVLYPLVHIPCLARDLRRRGEGMGSLLLIEAFRYTAAVAEIIGIAGLDLATTLQGRQLYLDHGFSEHPEGGNKLLKSIADIRADLQLLDQPFATGASPFS